MIYLASPYSHKSPDVKHERFLHVEKATSVLMRQGHPIFSPIVHCYEVARKFSLPDDADFWWNYNRAFLRRADAVWVLCVEGWEDSKGVKMEMDFAAHIAIPCRYLSNPSLEFLT